MSLLGDINGVSQSITGEQNITANFITSDTETTGSLTANTITLGNLGDLATYLSNIQAGVGTQGLKGDKGQHGDNVKFTNPTFTQLVPSTASFLTDTVTTTTDGVGVITDYHSLNIGINRGINNSIQLGTVTGTASNPSASLTKITDSNGDYQYTLNLALKNGTNGTNGTNGIDGTSSVFTTPLINSIAPSSLPYLYDSTSTSGSITTHNLTFGVNRGKNSTINISSVTHSTDAIPSVTATLVQDSNGDNIYNLAIVLKDGTNGSNGSNGSNGKDGTNGTNGSNGAQGPKGDSGDGILSLITGIGLSFLGLVNLLTFLSSNAENLVLTADLLQLELRVGTLESQNTYQSIGGTYPNGYTSFAGQGIYLFSSPASFTTSLRLQTDGGITQSSGTTSLLDTSIKGTLLLKDSSNTNQVQFYPNGTNLISNSTQFAGQLQTINNVSFSKPDGTTNLMSIDASNSIATFFTALSLGTMNINGNTNIINGNLVINNPLKTTTITSKDISMNAVNLYLGTDPTLFSSVNIGSVNSAIKIQGTTVDISNCNLNGTTNIKGNATIGSTTSTTTMNGATVNVLGTNNIIGNTTSTTTMKGNVNITGEGGTAINIGGTFLEVINIGTGALNGSVINIGSPTALLNINSLLGEFIPVNNFFNQL